MLKKSAVIGTVALGLLLAAPTAAFAADDPYVGPPPATIDDPIVHVCHPTTITFAAGYFLPGETVAVSIAGINAENASWSGDVAAEDGSLVFTFEPPADGQGTYEVTFTGAEHSYTTTITVQNDVAATEADEPAPVCNGAGSADGNSDSAPGDGTGLAVTGGEVSPWIVGVGAAGVVAGGALVVVGTRRRRRAD